MGKFKEFSRTLKGTVRGDRMTSEFEREERNLVTERTKTKGRVTQAGVWNAYDRDTNHVIETKERKPRKPGQKYLGVRAWAKGRRPKIYEDVLDIARDPAAGTLSIQLNVIQTLLILRYFFTPNHIQLFPTVYVFCQMFGAFVTSYFRQDKVQSLIEIRARCYQIRSDVNIMAECLYRFGNAFLIEAYVFKEPNITNRYISTNLIEFHRIPMHDLKRCADSFYLRYGFDRRRNEVAPPRLMKKKVNKQLNGANGEVTGLDDVRIIENLMICNFLKSLPVEKALAELSTWNREEPNLTIKLILHYIDKELYCDRHWEDVENDELWRMDCAMFEDLDRNWEDQRLVNSIISLLDRIRGRCVGYNMYGQLNGSHGEHTESDDVVYWFLNEYMPVRTRYESHAEYEAFGRVCNDWLHRPEVEYEFDTLVSEKFQTDCYDLFFEKVGHHCIQDPRLNNFFKWLLAIFLNCEDSIVAEFIQVMILYLQARFLYYILCVLYYVIKAIIGFLISSFLFPFQCAFHVFKVWCLKRTRGGMQPAGSKGKSFISSKVKNAGTGGKSKVSSPVSAPPEGVANAKLIDIMNEQENERDKDAAAEVKAPDGIPINVVINDKEWMVEHWKDADRPKTGYKDWVNDWHKIKDQFVWSAMPNVVTLFDTNVLVEAFEMDCLGAPFCGLTCIDIAVKKEPKVDVYLKKSRHFDSVFDNGTSDNICNYGHYRGVNVCIHYKTDHAEHIVESEANPEWKWVHLSLRQVGGGRLTEADIMGGDFVGHYYLMVGSHGNKTNLSLPPIDMVQQLKQGLNNREAFLQELKKNVFLSMATYIVYKLIQGFAFSFYWMKFRIYFWLVVLFRDGLEISFDFQEPVVRTHQFTSGSLSWFYLICVIIISLHRFICIYSYLCYAFSCIEVAELGVIRRNRNDDDLRCVKERRTKIEVQDHYQELNFKKVILYHGKVFIDLEDVPVEVDDEALFLFLQITCGVTLLNSVTNMWMWLLCEAVAAVYVFGYETSKSLFLRALKWALRRLHKDYRETKMQLVSVVRALQAIKEGEFLPVDLKDRCLATIGKMSYVNTDDSIPNIFKNTENFVRLYFKFQSNGTQPLFTNITYAYNAMGKTSYIGDVEAIRVNQMDHIVGGEKRPMYRTNAVTKLKEIPFEEKDKKIVAYAPLGSLYTDEGQLGPGNITITEYYSLIAAFAGRSMTKVVETGSEIIKEFIAFSKEWLQPYIDETDVSDIEEVEPTVKFVQINKGKKTLSAIKSKVDAYEKVKRECEKGRDVRENWFSCFVKLEDSTKVVRGAARVRPRLIMTMSDYFSVRVCQVMDVLNAWCHGPFSIFQVKGLSLAEFIEKIESATDGKHMVTDYSAFEASVYGAIKDIENYVITSLLVKSRLDAVSKAWLEVNDFWEKKEHVNIKDRNRKLKNRAGTFSIDSRCSGDYHTSVGNGIVNACLNAFAYFKKNGTLEGFSCIVEGDDGVIDPDKTDTAIINNCGFSFSQDVMGFNCGDTDFLRCRWVGGRCLVNVGRALKNLFWVTSGTPISDTRAKEILRAKALSLHATCPNHPILASAITRILTLTTPFSAKKLAKLNADLNKKFGINRSLDLEIKEIPKHEYTYIDESLRTLISEGALGFPAIPIWLQVEFEERLLKDEFFYVGNLLDEYDDIRNAKLCYQWKTAQPASRLSLEMIETMKVLANPGVAA